MSAERHQISERTTERVRLNPVIPGFAPDPSIVFVDGTYFLVNSSFHIFPGLPVYASKDLREWKHIGNALNRVGMLSLQDSLTKLVGPDDEGIMIAAQGGIMAPTIRYHKGVFYIVSTNVSHNEPLPPGQSEFQNFILSTKNIWADEWSDPVFFDFHGIDTSLFWDDDDRVYLIGAAAPSPETKIRQFEIDLKTGARRSEERLLWEGITKVYPEGPHMYKKDGWYYLLIAEGGCFADHHVIMARSRDIWGPYEANPANPVLAKTNLTSYIQYTGHGDLFQDPSGKWYFVCLGVRKNNGRFIMGRESVLTTATWPQGEYPVIDTVHLDVPLAIEKQTSPAWPSRRSFERPDVAFVHIRDPIGESYRYDGKIITLSASKGDIAQFQEPVTFIGKRQRCLNGSSSARLISFVPSLVTGFALKTGLCYYKDEHRFIRAFLDVDAGKVVLEVVNKARYIHRRTSQTLGEIIEGVGLTFGVDYTELEFVFWYSVSNGVGKKEQFGRMDTLDMTGHDFVGPIVGIFAVGGKEADVRWSDLIVA
ncbi:Xylosidase/arabinosidase [Colletotrichum truncatum]|uniref:Xylosidase/arabinosidase n=1 Tax=Colletotrichum truncatum TaxID=5467 RepID=A0ACC3ZL65_COLTU|nr:Xylosidase/arabinosidase [Colletotrichum truncatum]KAF6786946.1 Xylosidase/arabinosidase [Colletotrichum truncatum]